MDQHVPIVVTEGKVETVAGTGNLRKHVEDKKAFDEICKHLPMQNVSPECLKMCKAYQQNLYYQHDF